MECRYYFTDHQTRNKNLEYFFRFISISWEFHDIFFVTAMGGGASKKYNNGGRRLSSKQRLVHQSEVIQLQQVSDTEGPNLIAD